MHQAKFCGRVHVLTYTCDSASGGILPQSQHHPEIDLAEILICLPSHDISKFHHSYGEALKLLALYVEAAPSSPETMLCLPGDCSIMHQHDKAVQRTYLHRCSTLLVTWAV